VLKSRNNHPPGGGFWFTQPETGWTSSKWRSFNHVCDEVIAHRLANSRFGLPTDRETVEIEVENQITERLRSIPGGLDFIMDAPQAPPGSFIKRLRTQAQAVGAVAAGAEAVKRVVAGIGLYTEWFGKGPVTPEVAIKRGEICAQCPKNQPATGVNAWSETAGKELAAILGSLYEQKLSTPHDEKLNCCTACGCPTRAKIWCPDDLAVKHLTKKSKSELWEKCWLKPLLTPTKSVSS
jgi:hypothetical protein